MSLASRTFAPDLYAHVETYGPKHFVCLMAGDPRRAADLAPACVAVHRVAGSATEARAAELLASLDEATVRELRAARAAAFAAYDAADRAARRAREQQPEFPALPDWPTRSAP